MIDKNSLLKWLSSLKLDKEITLTAVGGTAMTLLKSNLIGSCIKYFNDYDPTQLNDSHVVTEKPISSSQKTKTI